jgi:hypothetical protein
LDLRGAECYIPFGELAICRLLITRSFAEMPKIIDPLDTIKRWTRIDDDTGCWNWIGTTNGSRGSPRMSIKGRKLYVTRVVLARVKRVSLRGMDVRQRCGNRCCVNPDHLEAIPREAARRGSQHPNAKLTDRQVQEIRFRYAEGERVTDLALEFHIRRSYLSRIVAGKAWAHLEQPGELN